MLRPLLKQLSRRQPGLGPVCAREWRLAAPGGVLLAHRTGNYPCPASSPLAGPVTGLATGPATRMDTSRFAGCIEEGLS
jgi:hypothetical protein